MTLEAKEGLALINGTQPSTASPRWRWSAAERLARAADIAVALSIDALRGSVHPFEARIHDAAALRGPAHLGRQRPRAARGQRHQQVARELRPGAGRLLAALRGAGPRRGAGRARFRARRRSTIEANAATDNPMVFAGDDEIVSGGNFHGAPVAIAADLLAIAAVQFATISERRSDRLVNPVLSELPAFLTPNSGLQSGYMMAQVTAAALASELKTLAHPASADTIPTSANREDHVSMSMGAALKAERAVALATRVVADRDAVRVPGARSVGAAQDVAAPAARARARARRRADARRRSSAGAGHRSDRRN